VTRFSERSLIETILRPLSKNSPGAFALGDDAALISPRPGYELVVTKDALVAGVHFFADDKPELIAAKALRVNLSDLYAKGATPAGYLLSLFLPADIGADWLKAFAAGLKKDQDTYALGLLGGDTVRTPGPFSLSVTMFGEVPEGKMVHRDGARPGDGIYVSGPIGDAALGLKVAREELQLSDSKDSNYLLQKYLLPDPDPSLIVPVREYASAAMDISDGLAGDLTLLCEASKAGAIVDVSAVPLSSAARKLIRNRPGLERFRKTGDRFSDKKCGRNNELEPGFDTVKTGNALISAILTGGDDYKILCTIPAAHEAAFTGHCGDKLSRIGEIEAGHSSVKFIGRDAQNLSLEVLSYRHF